MRRIACRQRYPASVTQPRLRGRTAICVGPEVRDDPRRDRCCLGLDLRRRGDHRQRDGDTVVRRAARSAELARQAFDHGRHSRSDRAAARRAGRDACAALALEQQRVGRLVDEQTQDLLDNLGHAAGTYRAPLRDFILYFGIVVRLVMISDRALIEKARIVRELTGPVATLVGVQWWRLKARSRALVDTVTVLQPFSSTPLATGRLGGLIARISARSQNSAKEPTDNARVAQI
jgi:hypothetical protein